MRRCEIEREGDRESGTRRGEWEANVHACSGSTAEEKPQRVCECASVRGEVERAVQVSFRE